MAVIASRTKRRWHPTPGVAGAVLLWVGASLFGDTPTRVTRPPIAGYFTAHRTNVTVGAALFRARPALPARVRHPGLAHDYPPLVGRTSVPDGCSSGSGSSAPGSAAGCSV